MRLEDVLVDHVCGPENGVVAARWVAQIIGAHGGGGVRLIGAGTIASVRNVGCIFALTLGQRGDQACFRSRGIKDK